MVWLSKLFTWAGGSSLTIPVLLLGTLILAHNWWLARDARIADAGKQTCNSAWLVALSKQQREAARLDAQRARELLEGERAVMEGLRDDLEKTRAKYADYIPSDDPRCLSDGVLDALRGH